MALSDWNFGSPSSLTCEKCIQNICAGGNETQHSSGTEQNQMHPLAFLHVFIWAQNVCHFLFKGEGTLVTDSSLGAWVVISVSCTGLLYGGLSPTIKKMSFLSSATA